MRGSIKAPKLFICTMIFLVLAIVFVYWQNNDIVVSESDYFSSKVPNAFDGFKIIQISDLHNKKFGENQKKLLNEVRSASPDIILVTGDLVDRRKYDLDTAMDFIRGATEISPVYYVSGNQEAWCGRYVEIKEALETAGVTVLDDIGENIVIGDSSINIMGVMDPSFNTEEYTYEYDTKYMKGKLDFLKEEDGFNLLLSHRPEFFDFYTESALDLVFTGHAHGGQIRIPGIGGLYSPGQGIFPSYTSGNYKNGETTMYVSRGLGNSIFPVRIFNRPEVVSVTLRAVR